MALVNKCAVGAFALVSQALLSAIPIVLGVFRGDALREDDKHPFCWMIRFENKSVIDSFSRHPDFT